MGAIDDSYKREEKKLILHYASMLLGDLILLNYQYGNKEYNGIKGKDLLSILKNSMLFIKDEEEKKVIDKSIQFLNFKYDLKVEDFNEFIIKNDNI